MSSWDYAQSEIIQRSNNSRPAHFSVMGLLRTPYRLYRCMINVQVILCRVTTDHGNVNRNAATFSTASRATSMSLRVRGGWVAIDKRRRQQLSKQVQFRETHIGSPLLNVLIVEKVGLSEIRTANWTQEQNVHLLPHGLPDTPSCSARDRRRYTGEETRAPARHHPVRSGACP